MPLFFAAGDWLTAQCSVKLWEEVVVDSGWSSRRYARVMMKAAGAALLTDV
ncbi:MAG: hypothetical protein QGI55_10465 [Pseudomonadales bacterium]|nr:hypothetical protein [Pseudomonadales bacterium]